MRKINLNLYPSGGYFFIESDGTRLRAGNWRGVIRRAIEYRRRAGLAPGQPEVEVMAQACQRNSHLCHEAVDRPPPIVPLKARVLAWLHGFARRVEKTPLDYVDAETVKGRTEICALCPNNISTGANTCSTCKEAIGNYHKTLLGPKRKDSRLGGCNILGADLPVAVHLDEVRVDNPRLPADCWRKIAI